jgi:hypothetical protein
MPLLGSSVQIHGLKGRPELNGQSAMVVSKDHARGRAAVRVEGEPQPLSLKLCNLKSTADPGGDDASSTSQHSELCLARSVEDLRSALYSLTRDAGRRLPLSFFVNDADRHLLARNIVLLWLAHHVPATHVLAVWFNLFLSASVLALLRQALDALTGPCCTDHLAKIGVDFWRPEDRRQIGDLLRDRKGMQLGCWRVIHLRAGVLNHYLNLDVEDQIAGGLSTGLFTLHRMCEPRCRELENDCQAEIAEYVTTGTMVPPGEERAPRPKLPNPTLFRSASSYDLHYAASPFAAFPHFAPEYGRHRPLTTLCLQEVEAWVAELKACGGPLAAATACSCARLWRRGSSTWWLHPTWPITWACSRSSKDRIFSTHTCGGGALGGGPKFVIACEGGAQNKTSCRRL